MAIESLANLLKFQSQMAADRAQQKIATGSDTTEQFTPSAGQFANFAGMLAPGAGIADAKGLYPALPAYDQPVTEAFSQEPYPSMAENIERGGFGYLDAGLQGLGVLGDTFYAAPVVGPILGATVGSGLKGLGALGMVARAASKGEKGITTLDDTKQMLKADVDTFARDGGNMVSPTLKALIEKAPSNLKGKQITEWAKANANKGVKPKELEFLGLDEFVEANPNATTREVVAGVHDNKVVVRKDIRGGGEGQVMDFDITTPLEDPLDGSLLYNPQLEDMRYDLRLEGPESTRLAQQSEILEHWDGVIARNLPGTSSNPAGGEGLYPKVDTFEDLETYLKTAGDAQFSSIDDVLEDLAKSNYLQEPYELIAPTSVDAGPGTFAFGNEGTGYSIFVDFNRMESADLPYSQTEAQIQLRNSMADEGYDMFRVEADEFDPEFDSFGGQTRYKQYVDKSLPGGKNYREIVFEWENAPEVHDGFAHFDNNEQIAHALVRDRKLADGSNSLHVDELQSDLHTEGSKNGYRTPEAIKEVETVDLALRKELKNNFIKLNKLKEKYNIPDIEGSDYGLSTEGAFENLDSFALGSASKAYQRRVLDAFLERFEAPLDITEVYGALNDLMLNGSNMISNSEAVNFFVPNYPFKDDWYEMSIKNLLMDAIDEGKDAISVSGSSPMIARYSDQYAKFYESLYDKKVPSFMKKLANKYGGEFEKGSLDLQDTFGERGVIEGIPSYDTAEIANATANIIRITPEMKAKILEEGLSSFALGGAVDSGIKELPIKPKTPLPLRGIGAL